MTVHLVGGGCGRPLWITMEAKQYISKAEHIVYDSLVHPDLLQLAPQECRFHFVGKRKGKHCTRQDEIDSLLVELGRTGRTVVRLKGGDPFIFGRGGEEAIALQDAHIPWTYTPGITASIGGAGMAGIPPTHRGKADSFTMATGHRKDGSLPDGETWKWLSSCPGTLSIYMGASSWKDLSDRLLADGMDPGKPCSSVRWGGWGRCTVRRGSLADMNKTDIGSPSVIMIGDPAGLDIHPESGALRGLQVAVARPFPESWETSRLLESMGADAYSIPIAAMEEIRNEGERSILESADWIVLSSPRGARLLTRDTDPRRIKASVAAIGQATASALAEAGIRADGIASPQTSAGLAELLSEVVGTGSKVVFFRNERGSSLPMEAVKAKGAEATVLPAYRMIDRTPPGMESYRKQWDENGLDAVVFGSAGMAEAWKRILGGLPGGAVPVAWGKTCGEAVGKTFGTGPLIMEKPETESMIKTLKKIKDIKGKR